MSDYEVPDNATWVYWLPGGTVEWFESDDDAREDMNSCSSQGVTGVLYSDFTELMECITRAHVFRRVEPIEAPTVSEFFPGSSNHGEVEYYRACRKPQQAQCFIAASFNENGVRLACLVIDGEGTLEHHMFESYGLTAMIRRILNPATCYHTRLVEALRGLTQVLGARPNRAMDRARTLLNHVERASR